MGADTLAMLFEQRAAFRFRVDAALPQGRVAQHFPDRHPGRLETIQKSGPDQDGFVVVPLTGLVAVGMRKQPDPLVVADGMG